MFKSDEMIECEYEAHTVQLFDRIRFNLDEIIVGSVYYLHTDKIRSTDSHRATFVVLPKKL